MPTWRTRARFDMFSRSRPVIAALFISAFCGAPALAQQPSSRDAEEANFDFERLIYIHDGGAWRRCRVEAKLDAKKFDEGHVDQDMLGCWAKGGSAASKLPVLSIKRHLEEKPLPGCATLLDYLPELAVRMLSSVPPSRNGRRS